MSVARTRHCTVRYRWRLSMIPWYRQLLSLIYGLGVMLIALWAIDHGQGGPYLILGTVGMSLLTLMLIFGVEINSVTVGDWFEIDFSNTGDKRKPDDE